MTQVIWEDNIKMEVGWGHGWDQSGSKQRQVAGYCEFGNKPSGSLRFREFPD